MIYVVSHVFGGFGNGEITRKPGVIPSRSIENDIQEFENLAKNQKAAAEFVDLGLPNTGVVTNYKATFQM